MQVKSLHKISGNLLEYEDLIFYLSQVAISKTDEEIRSAREELRIVQEKADKYRKEIDKNKTVLNGYTKDLSRAKAVKRVLNLIGTLNIEGVLRGKNRIAVKKLLNEIHEKSFEGLRNIEERLSVLLPDK